MSWVYPEVSSQLNLLKTPEGIPVHAEPPLLKCIYEYQNI